MNGGGGVAFELHQSDWQETVLYNFCSAANCSDGFGPSGDLAMDANGNLYGITGAGGIPHSSCDDTYGCGTIYELTPNGANSTMNIFHYFCQQDDCRDGQLVYEGVLIDSFGNLFGTTQFGGGHDIDQFAGGGGIV